METVRLFSEQVEEVEYITEAKEDGKKSYKIKGVFLQADIKNRNGRIYPMEVLEKEVDKYNENFIEQKRAYGELGHPDGPTVNLERVSHLTESLVRDGKNFIGQAKIMSTPMGEIFAKATFIFILFSIALNCSSLFAISFLVCFKLIIFFKIFGLKAYTPM